MIKIKEKNNLALNNNNNNNCEDNHCNVFNNGNSFNNNNKVNKSLEASDNNNSRYSFESIQETADFLLKKTKHRPKIGIICGSGLGGVGELIREADQFPYESIPNFPVSTVPGHQGRLVFGKLNGVTVICMQGRFHYYEGYPLSRCSMPVRVMKLIGVSHLIATNAAGGLNESYNLGDIMIVKDHINIMGFAGNNPLQGPNDPRFGLRFPPMAKAYDPQLIQKAFDIANEMGHEKEFHKGVYTCVGGPNYETVAELRLLRMLGVDAVGMSTVHEVITAKHCDMTVFAFSLITNKCVADYDTEIVTNHEEVIETGSQRQQFIEKFVSRIVKVMQNDIESKQANV